VIRVQLKNQPVLSEIKKQGIAFRFFESGDIFDIHYKGHQLNLLRGNQIDGSLMNLYLRVHENNNITFTPLIGVKSPSHFEIIDQEAIYYGTFEKINYQVVLSIDDFRWDFKVYLSDLEGQTVDVIYGQDIAIANQGSVLNSEPYTVQYIDYKAFKNQAGYTLCARQNQGKTSFMQLGSFTENVAYATDGFQFFGCTYKETSIPEVLKKPHLPSAIYQYEFSYFALQSQIIKLSNRANTIHFYGYYIHEDHGVITKPYQVEPLTINFKKLLLNTNIKHFEKWLDPLNQLNGLNINSIDIKKQFPKMYHIEEDEQGLLSFFTDDYHHVIMKQKELLVERPHGHLLIHHDLLHVSENVMSSTNFMFGVFAMHLVLGNTSFNKLLGDLRNPLNLQKISGLRLYIKTKEQYQILGLPSYYEIGGATSRWCYVLEDDVLFIDVFADMDTNQESLTFKSLKGRHYDVIMTQQLLMGVSEYQYNIDYDINGNEILFQAPKNAMFYQVYPHLKYKTTSTAPFDIISETTAFGCTSQHGLLIQKFTMQSEFGIHFYATIDEAFDDPVYFTYETANRKGTDYFKSFTQIEMTHKTYQEELSQLEHITFWYTHNALTHYASPHGLEQYNGAAWGTRDVCQGPVEFFMATQKFQIVREILIKVYKRQFWETGDFPQWYMFDKYHQIQAHESHGDIIIWPLRALAHYIKATDDDAILNEQIPYMSILINSFTEPQSLFNHVEKQIQSIIESFIPGTHLPRYGGGDWDDTLQPANHTLTTKMVSGWTVALLFETLESMADVTQDFDALFSEELLRLSSRIKSDYEKYIVIDGIPAGFVVFEEQEQVLLLHPKDQHTGLKHRLLPFTRSMISQIADNDKIKPYKRIIDDVFMHPDGVRLMDTAVAYKGGEQTYFTRAETAANFGREIGLQYVHAHIRYIEAMAKTGYADEAYHGLFVINPILLKNSVPNAYYRQSNVYFSSSDAWFMDRYEAKENFDRVKSGDILVKGGWRLYSSGPGIYINQLITRVLGIRVEHHNIIIDPVLPKKLDGLKVTYHYGDRPLHITFTHGLEHIEISDSDIICHRHVEKYRLGGYILDMAKSKNTSAPIVIHLGYK
jgi:1,2-beta-oligoglucan phosphorylase